MSTDPRQTWESYTATWKAESLAQRQAAFAACLTEDCTYADPLTEATGWQQLSDYMDAFHQQIPGGHFVTTTFMAHHGRSIATWEMRGGDGKTLGLGTSIGTYSGDGKLSSMTGFFETP